MTAVLVATAAVAATTLAGAAAGAGPTVGFAVRGNPATSIGVKPGTTVGFVARASMRRGDLLLIVTQRGSSSKLLLVARCTLSPCFGHWQERSAVSDLFRTYLTRGAGKSFKILGRSRLVRVSWKRPAPPPPPPPPTTTTTTTTAPPPPAAQPGNYTGKTADNEPWSFTIGPDGLTLTNLRTGQMNESCTPSADLYGGNLSFPGPYTVSSTGGFTLTGSFSSTVDGNASNNTVTITGQITGGTASGTYKEDTSFTENGVSYTCSTGPQTWTASRTG